MLVEIGEGFGVGRFFDLALECECVLYLPPLLIPRQKKTFKTRVGHEKFGFLTSFFPFPFPFVKAKVLAPLLKA